jgi:hypothetical protein
MNEYEMVDEGWARSGNQICLKLDQFYSDFEDILYVHLYGYEAERNKGCDAGKSSYFLPSNFTVEQVASIS